MRYARGETDALTLPDPLTPISIGEAELALNSEKPDLVFVALGTMVPVALEVAGELAGEGVSCSVINARFVKPLDEKLLLREIERARAVISMEENVLAGGLGEALLRLMADHGLSRPARLLGAPDAFVSYGSQADQLESAGLTTPQVLATARAFRQAISGRPSQQRTA